MRLYIDETIDKKSGCEVVVSCAIEEAEGIFQAYCALRGEVRGYSCLFQLYVVENIPTEEQAEASCDLFLASCRRVKEKNSEAYTTYLDLLNEVKYADEIFDLYPQDTLFSNN